MSFPATAREHAIASMSFEKALIQHPHATFFMDVETTAMIGAHMPPGSLLVIDRALTAQNGDIVVAVVNGEFMVRYLRKNEYTSWLYPANKQFRELKVTPEMNMTIWGVVTQIVVSPRTVMHR